jgi:formate hydrogenlyase subunit 6/NADH:ubiquinone oxidoreductase subunit I
MRRGTTIKHRTDHELVIERKMVTHHDVMTWDLDRCVGCQLGPKVCPKDALQHVGGEVVDGHVASKLLVDVDTTKCVFCGMCAVMCPVHAISFTLNDEPTLPVQVYEAFPVLVQSNEFHRDAFDWARKDFVLDNCPTGVISYDAGADTLRVDDAHCIRCRQCEVASDGAFTVVQPWEGTVLLRRELCVEGCLACADVCPTRALHVNDAGDLVIADYYCIKCGACVQVCPVKPIMESYDVTLRSQGVEVTKTLERVANIPELPIWVERWRVKHEPVHSGAWVEALHKLADDKANMVELERIRAVKRHDLIVALKGGLELREREAKRKEELLKALKGGAAHTNR